MSNSSEFMECCGEVVSWTKWGDGNHGMVHKIRRVSNGKTTWPNYVGISWVLPSCEFVGLWEYQTWTKSRLPSETEWREHRENHVYWTSSHISSAHHQLQASSEIHNCFSHILSHIGDPSVHCKVTVKIHSISHASFLSHFPWILPLVSPPSFPSIVSKLCFLNDHQRFAIMLLVLLHRSPKLILWMFKSCRWDIRNAWQMIRQNVFEYA